VNVPEMETGSPARRITPRRRDLAAAIIAVAVFIFLSMVVRGTVPEVDLSIRGAVHSSASPILTEALRFLTNFGSGWVLWPCGTLVVAGLMRKGRRRDAALFAVAVLGADILDEAMKLLFHRPRPDAFFGYTQPLTYSFPSGHAFVSACFYITLAEVLVPREWPPSGRAAAWTAAIVATSAIGFSRVYLGVHYPTDVLAGYAGAIAWTSIVRAAHRQWWHSPRSNCPSALE
jgi:undecaprenyl-diphosphatase